MHKEEEIESSTEGQCMVIAEDRQKGRISPQLFSLLFEEFGRWKILSFVAFRNILSDSYNFLLVYLSSSVLSFISQLLLSKFTGLAEDPSVPPAQVDQAVAVFLLVYALCQGAIVVFDFVCYVAVILRSIGVSRSIHGRIVSNLLRASVQRFYNCTLNSRICNRLSKDIYDFDMRVGSSLCGIMQTLFGFMASLAISFKFSSVLCLPVMVFLFVA
jgi:ABC-type multidrug transport system fused ATPase/permease subunit